MTTVTFCWILTMISGLCWARWWTVLGTFVTGLAYLTTQAQTLLQWTGWVQFGIVMGSPWLLASQRGHDAQLLTRLHAEEARESASLAEAARSVLSLQRSTQELETHITEITDVYHVTKETARALHVPELFTTSLETAPRLLSARGLRLIDLSDATPRVLRATRATDGQMVAEQADSIIREAEQTIIQQARTIGQASNGTRVRTLPGTAPEGASRVAWVPLWRERRPIGILVADELPEGQLKMLSIIANQLSLQLSRIWLYGQVEALAVTDALTELSVRRYFLERAEEELERSKRHGLSCTLLMMDLDRFKEKNDTYGHLVGDVILRDVAKLLKPNLREIDLIARYGGEEFVLLLLETDVRHAIPIAQRLKQLVEVHPIRAYDELLTQTISVGMAAFPEDAQTLELLIDRADQALFAAKRAGRNQVVRWSEALARPAA